MIRLVKPLDTVERIDRRDTAAIDVQIFGNDAGHRAKPARDAHGPGIGMRRQRPIEHARIEFIWLAVDVDIGSREMRHQKRRTNRRRTGVKLIDEMIFRAPDRMGVKFRLGEKGRRITATAMR